MASTQKKNSGGKGRKAVPQPEPPAYNAAARIVGGVVCALLALCILVSYFNVDALLLTFTAKVLRGALGYGYYLTAPALAAIACIQLGHKGRPVILRTVCVAVLPLLVGICYEILKWAGRSNSLLARAVSAPGLWLQHLTTFEPEDDMIEVAIAAVTPVLPKKPEDGQW